ncbi:hypothetical protein BGW39_010777 [Mortierella sp. 14UC]|nr:hypothetical protein BGW39_010777 [Mortierella sp. 14UC]
MSSIREKSARVTTNTTTSLNHLKAFNPPSNPPVMESLNKKTTAGISFASAAAAGANKPAAATSGASVTAATAPVTTTTGPAKNGGATTTGAGTGAGAGAVASALGSQSSAPSGTNDSKAAAITPSTNTNTGAATVPATTTTASNANNGAIDWVLGMNVKVVTQADEVYEGQVFAYDVIMNCVCPSKSVSAAATPTAYYSPSLGNNSTSNNSNNNNGNAGSRVKYDIRILKINYIKDVTPMPSSEAGNATSTTTTTSAAHNGQSSSIQPSSQSASSEDNITSNIYSTVLPAVGYVQLDKIQQREQQAIREAQAAAARIGVGVTTFGQEIFNALHKTLPCRWHDNQIIVMDEVIISPPYDPDHCRAGASSTSVLARVKKVLEGERSRLANGRK